MDELHRRLEARIREWAKRRKIAITHLPDRAAVTRSHFWAVLRGQRSPTLKWIAKIAKALDIDAADLLKRSSDSGRRRT